jgi:hypothetical protein
MSSNANVKRRKEKCLQPQEIAKHYVVDGAFISLV